MGAVDAQGNPLSWSTCNFDCVVNNAGPAVAARVVQIWRQYANEPQPIMVATTIVPLPANGSVPIAYRGNPVGAGSILLQTSPQVDLWLVDAVSGAESNRITL